MFMDWFKTDIMPITTQSNIQNNAMLIRIQVVHACDTLYHLGNQGKRIMSLTLV